MKLSKAAGADGIMAEHLKYSRPIVANILCKLYTAMWKHGYNPSAFGIGIIIPLIKGPGLDKSNVDNYRGITLSIVVSKLFEMIMLHLLRDFFFFFRFAVWF